MEKIQQERSALSKQLELSDKSKQDYLDYIRMEEKLAPSTSSTSVSSSSSSAAGRRRAANPTSSITGESISYVYEDDDDNWFARIFNYDTDSISSLVDFGINSSD